MRTVNLTHAFSRITDYWKPHIAGEINDSLVKLVKFKGEFVWHHHEREDELFLAVTGSFRMRYREAGVERELLVREGEFVVVPRGAEHMPVADEEVHVLLFEPKSTLNTGNVRNERTLERLDSL